MSQERKGGQVYVFGGYNSYPDGAAEVIGGGAYRRVDDRTASNDKCGDCKPAVRPETETGKS